MAGDDFAAGTFASPDFAVVKPSEGGLRRQSQSFGRFEFKYIVPVRLCDLIERDLTDFMEVDPFCKDQPARQYLVRSLYFDDPAFSAYYEKIDGVLNRRKFRLRMYSRDPRSACFLELKGRTNHFSYKHRTLLPYGVVERLLAQDWVGLLAYAGGDSILAQFVFRVLRCGLRPRVLVEYLRRPYISSRDYRFRATFDSQLAGLESSTLGPRMGRRRALLSGKSVLEIKFEQVVPAWFQRLIGAYELQRVSISKYCRAAEALGIVINLE